MAAPPASIAALTAVLTILKGLPLAYQRDLQEDKPPLFEAVGIYERQPRRAGRHARHAHRRPRAHAGGGRGGLHHRDVGRGHARPPGVPFRAAHHVVGALVSDAEAAGIGLEALHDDTIAAALAASDDPEARELAGDASIGTTVRAAADIDAALASCDVIGGTAPERVHAALRAARARIDAEG